MVAEVISLAKWMLEAQGKRADGVLRRTAAPCERRSAVRAPQPARHAGLDGQPGGSTWKPTWCSPRSVEAGLCTLQRRVGGRPKSKKGKPAKTSRTFFGGLRAGRRRRRDRLADRANCVRWPGSTAAVCRLCAGGVQAVRRCVQVCAGCVQVRCAGCVQVPWADRRDLSAVLTGELRAQMLDAGGRRHAMCT